MDMPSPADARLKSEEEGGPYGMLLGRRTVASFSIKERFFLVRNG